MPKELTHWHIARDALQRGIPVQVREIIELNPALFYIGAVAHDIPFYDLSQPVEARIEHLANQLHGVEGENTLEPLIEMMERALSQDNHQALLAFMLGMLTHFVADSTLHPMVYYLSGNYFAEGADARGKAVFRHRLLETAIDLWLETYEPLQYPIDLRHLWRESGENGRQAFDLLVRHYAHNGDQSILDHFKTAWRNHRFLQAAFSWSIPWKVLAMYRRLGHPAVEKHEALFYSQPLDLTLFEARIDWLHPVTGELFEMSLEELYDVCVQKVSSLFVQMGTLPPEHWPLVLRGIPPLSLDSGLANVPVREMKFFRTDPIEHQLRG